MPSAAMLTDTSAQRLASAVVLCMAAAPPFAEYLIRLFDNADNPLIKEHMGTFWDTAAAVKTFEQHRRCGLGVHGALGSVRPVSFLDCEILADPCRAACAQHGHALSVSILGNLHGCMQVLPI